MLFIFRVYTYVMCFKEDFVQNSRQWSWRPLHSSERRGIPSGRSSIKQHSFGRRGLFFQIPLCLQKLWIVPGYIRLDISATCPDAFQCSTSKRISFPNIDMGRQLQPSILDKTRRAEDLQLSRRQSTLSGHSVRIMGIVCNKSAIVRTLGQ